MAQKGLSPETIKLTLVNAELATEEEAVAIATALESGAINKDTISKTANLSITNLLSGAIAKLNEFIMANPYLVGLLAAAATIAAAAYIEWYNSAEQVIKRQKELREETKKNIDALREEEDEYQGNASNLEDLLDKYQDAIKYSREWYEIQKQIAEISSELIVGYDDEGRAIVSNTNAIKEQIAEYKKLAKEKREDAIKESNNLISISRSQFNTNKEKYENAVKDYNEYSEKIKQIEYSLAHPNLSAGDDVMVLQDQYNNYKTIIDQAKIDMQKYGESLEELKTDVRQSYLNLLNPLPENASDFEKNFRDTLLTYAQNAMPTPDDFVKLYDSVEGSVDAQRLFGSIFLLQEKDLSYDEYTKQAQEIYRRIIDSLDITGEDNQIALKVVLGIDDENIANYQQRLKKILDQYYVDKRYGEADTSKFFTSLNSEDLAITETREFAKTVDEVKESLGRAIFTEKEWNTILEITKQRLTEVSGASIEKPIKSIAQNISDLQDLENELDNLGEAIVNFGENKGKSFDLEDLDKIADYFLKLDQDKLFDASSLNEYFDVLANGNSTLAEQKNAINEIADAYLRTSGVLDGLNASNAQLYTTKLQLMGIENAEAIVNATLNQEKDYESQFNSILAQQNLDLMSIKSAQIQQMVDEGTITQQQAQNMALLALQERLASGNIDTTSDINMLASLAQQAGIASQSLLNYISLASSGRIATSAAINMLQRATNNAINQNKTNYTAPIPKAVYNGGKKVKDAQDKNKKNGGSGSKSSNKIQKSTNTIDLFKRRVDVLNDALEILDKNLNNVVGSDAKNTLLDQSMFITKEEIKNYSDAVDMYSAKAASALAKIPETYRDKVVNGEIELIDEVALGSAADEDDKTLKQLIDDYTGWADSVNDAKQKLAELKTELRKLELEKFKNIVDDYKNQTDIFENSQDLINKQIDLFKEAGQVIGEGFYSALISEENSKLGLLREEQSKLVKEMENGIANGTIEKGTDEWIEMINALKDVEGAILDSEKAVEEFNNAIQQLHWDTVERIKNDFSEISDEIEFLFNLLEDNDRVSDSFGNWSDGALAQLGLMAQSYEQHVYATQKLQEEIDGLTAAYQRGEYSITEYIEKLYELKDEQRSEIDASESAKKSIMDLAKARVDIMVKAIEDEIDAMSELIDKKKEALSNEKALHDYRLSIAESNKNIAKLEQQLAAMEGDDSQEAIARRKKLQQELADAKADLEEKEYDHSIETQEKALDQQMQQFEETKQAEIDSLNKSLEDEQQVIYDAFELVKQNTATVASEITLIAQEHGYQVSDTLTKSWQAGEGAIASYGSVLNASSSAFIGQLANVAGAEWSLQQQANNTAIAVATVFSVSANNLLGQLQASYVSEANLKTMTDTLHDSLVKCLEGGYNISSLTTQLKGIADSANAAASAVNGLMNALNGGGYTPVSANTTANVKYGDKYGTGSGYSAYDSNGTYLGTYDTYSQAKTASLNGSSNFTGASTLNNAQTSAKTSVQKFMDVLDKNKKTAKKAKGGLITKKSAGSFDGIAEALGEDHMIAVKDNEAVLTPMQTQGWLHLLDNLDAYNNMFRNVNGVNRPNVPISNNNSSPVVNLNYDSLITVEGDVNNSNIRQIENAVQNSINEQIKQFTTSLKRVGVR